MTDGSTGDPLVSPRVARSWLVIGSLLVCVALAGCSGSGEPSPESAVTSPATPSLADEATAAYQRYWDVYVQMANSGDVAASHYDGVAAGSFVEIDLKRLRDQADADVVRTGEPAFSDYKTTVSGRSATSLVCFDESKWGAKADGGVYDLGFDGPNPLPMEATLENRDGTWIVTDRRLEKEEPCP